MEALSRVALIAGQRKLAQIQQTRVIIFGIGGVGSWCAEGLLRSGIGHLTMVDADCVAESNLNRQLMATAGNIGQPKVQAMKERLTGIFPNATVTALHQRYDETTAPMFDLSLYDYVIDAIDSLDCKMLLIERACRSGAVLFSSMGAARKLNPQSIRVAEFWKVKGCPLGAALRHRFRKAGIVPSHPFQCVYSEEVLPNATDVPNPEGANGTLAHITGIFGLTLAGLVMQDILQTTYNQDK